jgi:D-alanyl-D-alanine carboxypeptidase
MPFSPSHRLPAATTGLIIATLISACTGVPGEAATLCQHPAATIGALPERSVIPADALPFPAPAQAALPLAKQQALHLVLAQFIDGWGRMHSLKGVTAAVVRPEGTWIGAYGVDGAGKALVATAAAPISSITETVTAAEVLRLVDNGQVDLDKFASTYIQNPLLEQEPTVRELLTHMSGIPDYFDTSGFAGPVAADSNREWTLDDLLAFGDAPLEEPGLFGYSKANYLLLQTLIEKVTGISYAQAMRRDVLSCLQGRLFVQTEEEPTPPLVAADTALGGVADGIFVPNMSFASALSGAGGIAADAQAVAEWGYRLYGGWVVSKNRTMEMAVQATSNRGLGTYITRTVGHGGHVPGHTSMLAVSTQHRQSIAVLLVGDASAETVESLVDQLEGVSRL